MWRPKSVVTIPIVALCVIELIDEHMEDVIETVLLAPTISVKPAIDIIDSLMVSQTLIVI